MNKEKKSYIFEFSASIAGIGCVYADSKEEALDLINNNQYDDILDTFDFQIENIDNICEEDD